MKNLKIIFSIVITSLFFSVSFWAWCQNWAADTTSAFSGFKTDDTSFCTLSEKIAKTNDKIFQAYSWISEIDLADVKSFWLYEKGNNFDYFFDSKNYYFCNFSGCNIITSWTKFNILKDKKQNISPFSYDWKNIYFWAKKLTRVDKNTFSAIQWNFWEDKNYIFRWDEKAPKTKVQNICNVLGLENGWNDSKNISKYENIFRFVPLSSWEQLNYILSWKNLITKNVWDKILTWYLMKTNQKKLISKPSVDISQDSYWNKFFKFENWSVLVKPAKKIAFDFVASWSTTKFFMLENDKSFVMNWSYFGYRNWRYFPAWAWFSWEQIEVWQTQPQEDINLRVVVKLDNRNQKLQFFYNDQYNISREENTNYVNAWPWIFKKWTINDIIFKNYSHWWRETSRTTIISDADGQIYFFISPSGMSISRLAKFIDSTNMFYCWFDIVNLDGGSSTAYSSEEWSYNENKRLPIFFSIWK